MVNVEDEFPFSMLVASDLGDLVTDFFALGVFVVAFGVVVLPAFLGDFGGDLASALSAFFGVAADFFGFLGEFGVESFAASSLAILSIFLDDFGATGFSAGSSVLSLSVFLDGFGGAASSVVVL